eukprot:scaffold32164_cov20-Tisochrysis_lutea.AAC.6
MGMQLQTLLDVLRGNTTLTTLTLKARHCDICRAFARVFAKHCDRVRVCVVQQGIAIFAGHSQGYLQSTATGSRSVCAARQCVIFMLTLLVRGIPIPITGWPFIHTRKEKGCSGWVQLRAVRRVASPCWCS